MIKKTRYRAGGKKRKHSDRGDRVYIHYTVFPRKKQGRTPSEREFFAVFLRVLHVFLRFHLAEAFEYSWVSKLSDSSSIIATAMLEQWSAIRS